MLTAGLIILAYFMVFFIVGTIIKNNSIVDIGWGLGYVVASWVLFFIEGTYHLGAIIINVAVSLWGLRLFYHILKRNLFAEEDFRYQNWRKNWGKWVIPRAFVQVYLLQGFFMWVIGSSSYFVNTNETSFNALGIIGLVIWLVGYLFEVFGDAQLKRHIASKKGGLITSGVWTYSRHPNYFGEVLMWSGLFLFGIFNGAPWYSIVSPLAMFYVLYFISTPLLEARMQKYEGWDDYAARTNKFFAWFPTKTS
jgi:steroid 5-alpha reductase family enzyme